MSELPPQWSQWLGWCRRHRWAPHQLRHAAATKIAREFGLEHARVVLGHRVLNTTDRYAELDRAAARDVARRIG